MRLHEHSGHKTSRAQRAAVARNDAAWTNGELEVEVKLPTWAGERSCRDVKCMQNGPFHMPLLLTSGILSSIPGAVVALHDVVEEQSQ